MIGSKIRSVITHFLLPLFWKKDTENAAKALKQFSEVEFDSAWQYLNAMNHVDVPKTQLMLFENLLEEMEHSDAFLHSAHQLATQRLAGQQKARTVLVNHARQIPYFLAFAHESEKAICAQFKGYARACQHLPTVAKVFNEIACEEEKHEREAHVALVTLIGSRQLAARLVWQVRLNKSWQSWMRGTKYIGEFMFAFWLGAVYFLFGPILRGYCTRRLVTENMNTQAITQTDITMTKLGEVK